MRTVFAIAFLVVPLAVDAAPTVEECSIDARATEGAGITRYIAGDEVRHLIVVWYGEMGQYRMAVTPMPDGDAVLDFEVISYSRHIWVGEEPIKFQLTSGARAIVLGGTICEAEVCFRSSGDITREGAQEAYDEYLSAAPRRSDCADLRP